MPVNFNQDQVIILLGAGASYQAGIPVSAQMITRVEELLKDQWSEYRELYYCIKSSILYAAGIRGDFSGSHYNIEALVGMLDELIRGNEHPLFPFIGSWSPKLIEVTRGDLGKIREFRDLIVRRLRDQWVQLKYDSDANYYAGLHEFQKEYNYPLRVFSLNYDLCVEKACKKAKIQRGFGPDKKWEWRLFDESNESNADIYLYKLHGSIDWTRGKDDKLTYVEGVTHIEPEDLAIIFGVTYKLQYVDPFLFFAYQFRLCTLEDLTVLVCIGYGFGDDHINGILRQSLLHNPSRRLVSVSPKSIDGMTPGQIVDVEKGQVELILSRLGLKGDEHGKQVHWWNYGAKEFLESHLKIAKLAGIVPLEQEPFPELLGEAAIPLAPDVGPPIAEPAPTPLHIVPPLAELSSGGVTPASSVLTDEGPGNGSAPAKPAGPRGGRPRKPKSDGH